MLKLNCAVQNYAWGKVGKESEVAKLFASGSNEEIDEGKPYAELWMGTHASGPSTIAEPAGKYPPKTTLKEWIGANESSLGDVLLKRFGGKSGLPFLFKVLSVQTALSIQAHPHKALAESLHAERPHVYKDDNHKPEMTLALTDFEALSCFVSHAELHTAIIKVPELAECIGEESGTIAAALATAGAEAEAQRQDALKRAFKSVMTRDSDAVQGLIKKLCARLNDAPAASLSAKEKLVLRLNDQYPGDVGIFAAYFLNYVTLKPGQAVSLEANEPHAYLSGNCVEVMATSDNVVRAGLTPKLRDTDVLCSMLTYKTGLPQILEGEPVGGTGPLRCYKPPFDEFQINTLELKASQETLLEQIQGPLLVLVYEGSGHLQAASSAATNLLQSSAMAKGDVFFVPDGQTLNVKATSDSSLFIASANSRIF